MSEKLRILVAVGTRPEAIKLAPVIRALRARPRYQVRLCLTAQHREMLDQTLAAFDLAGDVDLNLMREDQTLPQLAASILTSMADVLASERPHLAIVQGDTTTVFATALAAFFARVPIAHVEAGLRTGDLAQPFPEEANRRLAAALVGIHFAPTERAKQNLLAEGVPEERIHVTGNTVIDALLSTSARFAAEPELERSLSRELDTKRRFVLITGHRRESFGAGFESICRAIRASALRYPDVDFVYPVHLNPRVRGTVHAILGGASNVRLLEPLDYLRFVYLLERCRFVLTDSGGIQEEAPTFAKPVLVMREKTERPEAIEAGAAKLVGTDQAVIEREVALLMEDGEAYRSMSRARNPFGDGTAAERIASILDAWHP